MGNTAEPLILYIVSFISIYHGQTSNLTWELLGTLAKKAQNDTPHLQDKKLFIHS